MDSPQPMTQGGAVVLECPLSRLGFRSRGIADFISASPCKNPSLAGFEELALPLLDSLYNVARWLSRNEDEAEDLVQETYLKALRGFPSFQPGTHFRGWIFQILKNTFYSSRSRVEWRMTHALDPEMEWPDKSPSPELLLIGSCHLDAVRDAIEQLPPDLREVILLCDVEDESYREIAEILSIPIGTVMSRLSRARRRVRQSLEWMTETRTATGTAWVSAPGLSSRSGT